MICASVLTLDLVIIKMKLTIPAFETGNILVVGDVMLDRYWHGDTSRISPEAPVPVVHVQTIEERAGGAGNVALNLASLGTNVNLLGLCGNDWAANQLEKILEAAGVNVHLLRLENVPTTVKLRILSLHQQLIRLDFEEKLQQTEGQQLLAQYEKLMIDSDAIILSDYSKGALLDAPALIQLARQHHIPVLADPKGNNFSRYHGATLITPNRREFEAVVGECANDAILVERGMNLIAEHDFKALLITRGEQGMTLLRPQHPPVHLPAQARDVFDVTGAGDTVIAVLAAALAAGENLESAAQLANAAAGIVVGKLGTATVTTSELRNNLQNQHTDCRGVFHEDQLAILIENAKAAGERIVMTNGCFDIIHAGHVSYLEQAKSLGDRLVVAINDDASVQRLKGSERPLNSLENRMTVLSALSMVDWVVPFSEDTPERLITRFMPHTLVKGGDYQVEEIAGSQAVLTNGGQVKILDFVPGCSTTGLVEKIRQHAKVTE